MARRHGRQANHLDVTNKPSEIEESKGQPQLPGKKIEKQPSENMSDLQAHQMTSANQKLR